MEFKQALGLENPNWQSIGKHLSALTNDALKRRGMDFIGLTNYLRECGNNYIEPDYVAEYLEGRASFGCFFPQLREHIGIVPGKIFPSADGTSTASHLRALDDYLTNISNPDSLVIFLKHTPGRELREHVKNFLSEKRRALLGNPYLSLEIGIGKEPEEIDALMKSIIRSHTDARVNALSQGTLPLSDSLSIMYAENSLSALHLEIRQAINKKCSEGWSRYSPIDENSEIVIQPAVLRGKGGFTIDFFPDADAFDRRISGEDQSSEFKELNLGLQAWREAYMQGTFSTLSTRTSEIQKISNLMMNLEAGVDKLVPTRDLRPAERYEIHQRWEHGGGTFRPGVNLKGPGEVERQIKNRPDPLGRSEFENTAYNINSDLTIALGLFNQLPDLVNKRLEIAHRSS
ncbi:MAG TPA: hypothetical protein VJK03_04470 [Candidatus Nanoarchaeia archaeon]|nr:hypothetical protein [Candidatus Nanoarchaeia archaeon]